MARPTHVYTIGYVATLIGENLELIQEVASNSDNIDYGEMSRLSHEDGHTVLPPGALRSERTRAISGLASNTLATSSRERCVVVGGMIERWLICAREVQSIYARGHDGPDVYVERGSVVAQF